MHAHNRAGHRMRIRTEGSVRGLSSRRFTKKWPDRLNKKFLIELRHQLDGPIGGDTVALISERSPGVIYVDELDMYDAKSSLIELTRAANWLKRQSQELTWLPMN